MGLGDDLMKDVSDLVKDLDERSVLGGLEVKWRCLGGFWSCKVYSEQS